MSLRSRLLIGVVALVALGLGVTGVATYTALRAFMLARVDEQLAAMRAPVLRALGPERDFPPARVLRLWNVDEGTVAQVRDSDGMVLSELVFSEDPLDGALPDLTVVSTGVRSVSAVDGSVSYRADAWELPDRSVLVIAVPLTDVSETLGRFVLIHVAVSLAVVTVLGATAWWVVRLGLRPLVAIERTAAEIAAGDLSCRIEAAGERTEVGRLGGALNAMLAQIEHAFAERKASEERLRRFLADASHELRTPLTSIRGYAELFRRGADARPDDLAKSMQRIEEEAARMGVLVEDLLVLARLDEGRPLEQDAIDLVVLASDAVADARAIDPDRPIAVDAPPSLEIEADEVRLRQVLTNLLSNTLAHTPRTTAVEVTVMSDGDTASVSVIDHGPGLDPDEVARVFERFYRSDPSRARETGGAGLGLAIVAAITHAHGGAVSVEQTPGGGATFRVSLPIQRSAQPQGSHSSAVDAASTTSKEEP